MNQKHMNRHASGATVRSMLRQGGTIWLVLATVGLLVWGTAGVSPAGAQDEAPAEEAVEVDFADVTPGEAVFFVQRQGHTAVRDAFVESNLGKLGMDPAINEFVHGSRVGIGRMMIQGILGMYDEAETERWGEHLHSMMLPFWYEPGAMFIMADGSMGFISQTGEYAAECGEAVELLGEYGVPAPGEAGQRQAFTVTYHGIEWSGTAKDYRSWLMPDPLGQASLEDVLGDKQLFLVAWQDDTLLITTGLKAAERFSELMTTTDVDVQATAMAGNSDFQLILAETPVETWALQWFLEMDEVDMYANSPSVMVLAYLFKTLPFDYFGSVMGGTMGYEDKVFTERTFIPVTDAASASAAIFKEDGDYSDALAMVPSGAMFALAGQVDMEVASELMTGLIPAEFADAITELVAASDGNVCLFSSQRMSMTMMAFYQAMPAAVVMGVSDSDAASQAIGELTRDMGPDRQGPQTYRGVEIKRLADSVQLAVLDDRIIVSGSADLMRTAIDVAKDESGGTEAGSDAERMIALAGEGAMVYQFDVREIASFMWPMLLDMGYVDSQIGLANMPSTSKLVGLLEPNVSVFTPKEKGLYIESRGQLPLGSLLSGSGSVAFLKMMIGW